ncbi:MAG: glycosyltransferase family 2 protein [Desulfuromonadales bacterium]
MADYLRKRGAAAPWRIHHESSRLHDAAVVIPALAESNNLPLTLGSLLQNPQQLLERTLIVVVVNQRSDASTTEKDDNLLTLDMLPHWKREFGLANLAWVDAASAGNELAPRQGVGLARKIGLDLALPMLSCETRDPLLICLDADTLVQPDYLPAIFRHFNHAVAGGACIPYRHQQAGSDAGQTAIDRYELFLRAYVFGLQLAASPYAFHTVGSAMACRASAYIKAGGMNRRLAGEDFYFLQQLHKTAGVEQVTGTVVFPSPRSSLRVPFGTGRAVGDMLAEGTGHFLFYQPAVFEIVKEWLHYVSTAHTEDGTAILSHAARITPVLSDFLVQAGFNGAWDNLRRHNPPGARLDSAFNAWFDAFRTMKLIHFLCDNGYQRVSPDEAIPPLLESGGYEVPPDMSSRLELLRRLQKT